MAAVNIHCALGLRKLGVLLTPLRNLQMHNGINTNLCDTSFNKDLSNEPNFGLIHLARQYL
jgi:hypothetical protein